MTLFASTEFGASGKDGVKAKAICGANIGTAVASITLLEDDGSNVAYSAVFVGTVTIKDDVTED